MEWTPIGAPRVLLILVALAPSGCTQDAVPSTETRQDLSARPDLSCASAHCNSDSDCQTGLGPPIACNPKSHRCTGRHECIPAAPCGCDPGSTCLQVNGTFTCLLDCPHGTDSECPPGRLCCGQLRVCVDPLIDVTHCGACGHACGPIANGSPGCTSGVCTIGACNAGFADCDHALANGCEVSLSSDPANCGGCGDACAAFAHGLPTCSNGRCSAVCAMGYSDCNSDTTDGCEVSTSSDARNCGSCGLICGPGTTCRNGICG